MDHIQNFLTEIANYVDIDKVSDDALIRACAVIYAAQIQN